jgi:hypothetical protein
MSGWHGDAGRRAGGSVSTSVGAWREITLIHEVPGRAEVVSFVVGIEDGMPVRSGSPDPMIFSGSDYCQNSDPGIELSSFTADERRLDVRNSIVAAEIETVPWIDGERELPEALSVGALSSELSPEVSVQYWHAFLAGGVVEAVAYDYGTFVLTEAFQVRFTCATGGLRCWRVRLLELVSGLCNRRDRARLTP